MAVAVAVRSKSYDWQLLADAFRACLDDRRVMQRKEELLVYECDGLTSYRQRPAIVTLPRTTAEVAAVVKLCNEYSVPL